MHPSQNYTVSRHFYRKDVENRNFEQSLDVYEPNVSPSNRPTVVFVVGSGWLGHAWWIYYQTNWWNMSGPRTMAQLGYRCIAVRHSGGFFQVPRLDQILFLISLMISIDCRQFGVSSMTITAKALAVLLAWAFLKKESMNAATLNDMVEDVARALSFVKHDLNITTPVVLGGYSSGGHVVATLLSEQRERLERELNIQEWISGVLYVSGLLSTDCWILHAVTLTVFGTWASRIPSPLGGKLPPRYLPHVIVGCYNELFGLPFLDGALCAKRYHDWLRQDLKVDATCRLVRSNHWSILASRALAEALTLDLQRFTTAANTTRNPTADG